MHRRTFMLTALAGFVAGQADASGGASGEMDLWPAAVASPDNERLSRTGAISRVSRPRLRPYRPGKPGGTAILVIAGGGYARIEAGKESTPACRWLQSQGITAFELIYRLPDEAAHPHAPFEDARRAMRIIRAAPDGFSTIGLMGFSAGGHLAGMTAVRSGWPPYPPADAADRLGARPDFAALLYPVITLMPPFDDTRTRRELIGRHPTERQSREYSVDNHVDGNAPPMFIAQAKDDPVSPVENSKRMSAALQSAGVKNELHLFDTGGHGWGLGKKDSEPAVWPALFLQWAKSNDFIA